MSSGKKLGYTFDYNRNMIVCDVTAVCIFVLLLLLLLVFNCFLLVVEKYLGKIIWIF
jgi:hypothetical protein